MDVFWEIVLEQIQRKPGVAWSLALFFLAISALALLAFLRTRRRERNPGVPLPQDIAFRFTSDVTMERRETSREFIGRMIVNMFEYQFTVVWTDEGLLAVSYTAIDPNPNAEAYEYYLQQMEEVVKRHALQKTRMRLIKRIKR